MIDSTEGLLPPTPSDWKELKLKLKDKTDDEKLDIIINHIDPDRTLNEKEFEAKALPYIDRMENDKQLDSVKQLISDMSRDYGNTLIWSWLLPGLAKTAKTKALRTRQTLRRSNLVPTIDANDDPLHNPHEAVGSNYVSSAGSTNRNLHGGPPGDENGLDFWNENDFFDDDNTMTRKNLLRASTGDDLVDGLTDAMSPAYKAELMRNPMLRDITHVEYEEALRHRNYFQDNYLGFFRNQGGIDEDWAINTFGGTKPITAESIKENRNSLLFGSELKDDLRYQQRIQAQYNNHQASLSEHLYKDNEKFEELQQALRNEPLKKFEFNEFNDLEKKEILNRARNQYIEISGEDMNEARRTLKFDVASKIVDVLALQPLLRLGLKSAIALYKNLPDKSISGWQKLANIIMESGLLPYIAIDKLKLYQYIPANWQMKLLKYYTKFANFTGISWLADKIRYISRVFPHWTNLNLVEGPARMGAFDLGSGLVQAHTIAAQLEASTVKDVGKFIAREMKNNKEKGKLVSDMTDKRNGEVKQKIKTTEQNNRESLKQKLFDYNTKRISKDELKKVMSNYLRRGSLRDNLKLYGAKNR